METQKSDNWLIELAGGGWNSSKAQIQDRTYLYQNGVFWSDDNQYSEKQEQTQKVFGFKWNKRDTFESRAMLDKMKAWLLERYGSPETLLKKLPEMPVVLDAGCGGGMSGLEYWRPVMNKIRYVGIDISNAVEVASQRFHDEGHVQAAFMRENIGDLPFKKPLFDIIFSEGVLHHTDSTEATFQHLSKLLKPGGYFMFYVYKRKGPIREFTDDYIRHQIQNMSPEAAWESMKPLTKLGIELGKMDLKITVPEAIDLLGIPAGESDLQRFFYWNVFKAFYDPKLSFDEMLHINFDWYAPKNAHRHTIEEIRAWCKTNNLNLIQEKIEPAGITVVAQKLS